MQLGFVTAILNDLSFEEVLRFASDEGFDCVEVMCWPVGKAERKYAGVTHVDVTNFTAAAADDVLALCDKHRVAISALGYYPNILSANGEESQLAIEHLRKVIVAAQLLARGNSPWMRTFAGKTGGPQGPNVNTFIGADHHQPLEHNLRRFAEVWPAIIQHAEEQGVYVGIENCPMLFTGDEWPSGKNLAYSPAIWRRMYEVIPSAQFGLNYDPSHLVWMMMDYLQPIREFASRLFHVHAKDMKIERDKLNQRGILALGWSTPKIPGLGDVDWPRFVSALTDAGYDGPVCIEVEDDAFRRHLEDRQRSLRIARDVLRPMVQ
jgi:sugar phosphate isomerase/epimerase